MASCPDGNEDDRDFRPVNTRQIIQQITGSRDLRENESGAGAISSPQNFKRRLYQTHPLTDDLYMHKSS